MQWDEEVKLWGLVIVYFTIYSFLIAVGILFIKWNWVLFHACIPRLPIRAKWPPYLFVALHIINIGALIAINFSSIRTDFISQPESPLERVERLIGNIKPGIDRLRSLVAEFPLLKSSAVDPEEYVNHLGELVGYKQIAEFNLSSCVITMNTDEWWENSAKKCDTGVNSTELRSLANFLEPHRALPLKILDKSGSLKEILKRQEPMQRRQMDSDNSWKVMIWFLDDFEPAMEVLRDEYEEQWAYKREFENVGKYDRIKLIYIPSTIMILITILSIFTNIRYTNSPVPPPFVGFLKLAFYALTIQAIFFSFFQAYIRHREMDEARCDIEVQNSQRESYYGVYRYLHSCASPGRNEMTALKDQFWNRGKQHLVKYQTFVTNETTLFLTYDVDGFLKEMEEHRKVAQKLEKGLGELPDVCFEYAGMGAYKEPVSNINRYFDLTTKFARKLGSETLKNEIYLEVVREITNFTGFEEQENEINKAILEADFDCREPYDSTQTYIDCEMVDNFYKSVAQCSVLVCMVVCAFLLLMSHRRTDLRQFADDSRQEWVYKIDKRFRQLAKEFHEKVKMYTPPKATFHHFDANECRNRYQKVLCMDATRVVLMGWSQYIHASWVKIPKTILDPMTHQALFGTDRQYLVTQAPIADTIWEFYGMCWQQNVSIIMMLCSMVENGVQKCAPYYPTKKGASKVYNNYKVTCFDIKEHPVKGVKWAVLKLESLNEIYTDPKFIDHVYATWWPEKKAPDDPHLLIELYEWVNGQNDASNPPIVVHSSAGIGRAGTYVAFDYLNARTHEDHYVRVWELVRDLRKMRWGAIETEEQFIYLVVCLVEFASMEGVVDHELGPKYIEEYTNYKNEQKEKEETQTTEAETTKKRKLA